MNNKVCVLFTQASSTFERKKYEAYYIALPSFISKKVNAYVNYLDQVQGILGKHLLLECLKRLKVPERLNSFDYDTNRRPFLKEFPKLDFNISHSGSIITCAASLTMRLGIDIEKLDTVELSNFKMQFSPNEWQSLQETSDWKNLFFQYWVKKEAITKTDGQGISLDYSKVEVIYDRMYYNNLCWLFTPLAIHSDYLACLATNKIPTLQLEEIFF